MKKIFLMLYAVLLTYCANCQNYINSLSFLQKENKIIIDYELTAIEKDSFYDVIVKISNATGVLKEAHSFSGDFGRVNKGGKKQLVWDVVKDIEKLNGQIQVELKATLFSNSLVKLDRDGDSIPDKDDNCPDIKGPACTNGCPDKDADCIADKDDNCPDQKGFLIGCPDSDGDGIADKDDNCPYAKGPNSTKGCPDFDEDGILDNIDVCPNIKGPACTNGCPDKDQDCIADKDDNCPNVKGPNSTKGCPDSDGDGIADKDDNCPNAKGPNSTKGCPDSDEDGIVDNIDDCPNAKGPNSTKGCPDSDGDGIADKDDECPYLPGKKETKGCPDFDNDGVANTDDECPYQVGKKETKGCPDFDNDGIADKDDQCFNLKGNAKNNGCPTQALLRYKGDNLGCILNLTFKIGNQIFVPNSNMFYIIIEEGTYNYTITGEIRCATGACLSINSTGTIKVEHRSILDFSFNLLNCRSVLINLGKY